MEGYQLRKRHRRKPDYTTRKKCDSRNHQSAVKVKIEPGAGSSSSCSCEDVNRTMPDAFGRFPCVEKNCTSRQNQGTGNRRTSESSKQTVAYPRPMEVPDNHHDNVLVRIPKEPDVLHAKTAEEVIDCVAKERNRAKQSLKTSQSPYLTRLRASQKFQEHRLSKSTSASASQSTLVNKSLPEVPGENVGVAAEASGSMSCSSSATSCNDSQTQPCEVHLCRGIVSDRRLRKMLRELVAKRMTKLNESLVFNPRIGALARRILLLERQNRNLNHTAKTLNVALSKALIKENTNPLTESRGTQVSMGMILSRAAVANKGETKDDGHSSVQTTQVSSAANICGLCLSQTSRFPVNCYVKTSASCPTSKQGIERPSMQVPNGNYVENAGNRCHQIKCPQTIGMEGTSELCSSRPQPGLQFGDNSYPRSSLNQNMLAEHSGISQGSVLRKSCLPSSQQAIVLSETTEEGQMNEDSGGHVLAHPDTCWPTASLGTTNTHAMLTPRNLSLQSNVQHASFSAPLCMRERGHPHNVVVSNQNDNSAQITQTVSQLPGQIASRVTSSMSNFVPIAPRPAPEHSNAYHPYYGWFHHQPSVQPAAVPSELGRCPQDTLDSNPSTQSGPEPEGDFYQTGILPGNCVSTDGIIQHNNTEACPHRYGMSSSNYRLHRFFGKPSRYQPYTARHSTSTNSANEDVISPNPHQTVGSSSIETDNSVSQSSIGTYYVPFQENHPSRENPLLNSNLKHLEAMSTTAMPDRRGRMTTKEQQSHLGSIGMDVGNEGQVKSANHCTWTSHHFAPPCAPHVVGSTSQYQCDETYGETWNPWRGQYVATSRSGKRTGVMNIPTVPPSAWNQPSSSSSAHVGQQQAQKEQHEMSLQIPHPYQQQYNYQHHLPPQQHRVYQQPQPPQQQPQPSPRRQFNPGLKLQPIPQSHSQQVSHVQLRYNQDPRRKKKKEPVSALDEEHGQQQQQQNQEHVLAERTRPVQDHVDEQQKKQEQQQELQQHPDQKDQRGKRREQQRLEQSREPLPPQQYWKQDPRQKLQLTQEAHTTASPYAFMQRQKATESGNEPDRNSDPPNQCSFTGNDGENKASTKSSVQRRGQASAKFQSTQLTDKRRDATDAHEVGAIKEQLHHDNPRSPTHDTQQVSNNTCIPLADINCSGNIPPKPVGHVIEKDHNVVFSWNMRTGNYIQIKSYELFILTEENSSDQHYPGYWTQIGKVDALPLPMACTLSQFCPGVPYTFKVRAVDSSGQAGPYSEPCSVTLSHEFHCV